MLLAYVLHFDIFAAGNNRNGKLGIGSDPYSTYYQTHFTNVKVPQDFNSFALGLDHVVAITSSGELYGWGSNLYNQLLSKVEDASQFIEPHLISWFSAHKLKVRHADAGTSHTIVLTTDGYVYTFGDNTYSQLGAEYAEISRTTVDPIKLSLPENIQPVWVTAIENTSYIRMSDGSVYVFGSCVNSICGPPIAQLMVSKPTRMNISFSVARIYVGYQSVVMVDSDGITWAVGNNYYGQLCRAVGTNLTAFTAIPNLSNVVHVSFGEKHSVFIDSGAAIGCGNGDSYQLGAGNTGNHSEAVVISPDVDSASATASGTIIVRGGKIKSTGNSVWGELGLSIREYQQLTDVPTAKAVKNVYAYKDFSFVMQELAPARTGMAWWAILLIVLASLLLAAAITLLVIWVVKNKRNLFDMSKYKKIDERSALTQDGLAGLEAW